MHDKNAVKRLLTSWISKNMTASEDDLKDYFQSLNVSTGLHWLLEETQNYFHWRKQCLQKKNEDEICNESKSDCYVNFH